MPLWRVKAFPSLRVGDSNTPSGGSSGPRAKEAPDEVPGNGIGGPAGEH